MLCRILAAVTRGGGVNRRKISLWCSEDMRDPRKDTRLCSTKWQSKWGTTGASVTDLLDVWALLQAGNAIAAAVSEGAGPSSSRNGSGQTRRWAQRSSLTLTNEVCDRSGSHRKTRAARLPPSVSERMSSTQTYSCPATETVSGAHIRELRAGCSDPRSASVSECFSVSPIRGNEVCYS